MPFRGPSAKEAFRLAVKDGHSRIGLGKGALYTALTKDIMCSVYVRPVCAMGWGYEAIGPGREALASAMSAPKHADASVEAGKLIGLTSHEVQSIVMANDGGLGVDIEAVEKAINDIEC